jgi:tRNA G10  N-methylase Trm11
LRLDNAVVTDFPYGKSTSDENLSMKSMVFLKWKEKVEIDVGAFPSMEGTKSTKINYPVPFVPEGI